MSFGNQHFLVVDRWYLVTEDLVYISAQVISNWQARREPLFENREGGIEAQYIVKQKSSEYFSMRKLQHCKIDSS